MPGLSLACFLSIFLSYLFVYIKNVYECLACIYVYMYDTCVLYQKKSEEGIGSPKTGITTVICESYHVDTWNRTQVLWNSCQCS